MYIHIQFGTTVIFRIRFVLEVSDDHEWVDLVAWLAEMVTYKGQRQRGLSRSLVMCLAWLVDRSDLWEGASSDALLDAPVVTGAKRVRRLDPNLVRAVAQEAGRRTSGRTGGAVSKSLHRFRRWGSTHLGVTVANAAGARRVWEYWRAVRRAFHQPDLSTVSVCLDGTRMSGKDTLYITVCLPEAGIAAWCPPQALSWIRQGGRAGVGTVGGQRIRRVRRAGVGLGGQKGARRKSPFLAYRRIFSPILAHFRIFGSSGNRISSHINRGLECGGSAARPASSLLFASLRGIARLPLLGVARGGRAHTGRR